MALCYWNKTDREKTNKQTKKKQMTNIVWYDIYVDCKKIQQTCELNNKEATHRYRGKTRGYQWGEGIRGIQYCVVGEGGAIMGI